MKRLMQKHLDIALKKHKYIVEIYKSKYSEDKKRDWRTYEQRLAMRIKEASREIEPVIEQAYSMIKISKPCGGRPKKIPITKLVLILLLKDIFQLSNRKMANLLAFFTALTGIDVGHKTVERIYSDELARATIHNTFLIMTKQKGIENSDASGDGTGYSLTVTKHYRNEREKDLKEITKSKKEQKRKLFAHTFAFMDLKTGLYIGYGTSMRSEKEAYEKSLEMTREFGITIDSIRLDKYYSHQSITEDFSQETKIYLIPKTNATIKGSPEWKSMLRSYIDDPLVHLKEYYKRNNSESGFSADKRACGWKVWQKKDERIDTALLCKGVWHNLMLLN